MAQPLISEEQFRKRKSNWSTPIIHRHRLSHSAHIARNFRCFVKVEDSCDRVWIFNIWRWRMQNPQLSSRFHTCKHERGSKDEMRRQRYQSFLAFSSEEDGHKANTRIHMMHQKERNTLRWWAQRPLTYAFKALDILPHIAQREEQHQPRS